ARIIIIGTSCSREAKNIAELSDWLWDKYRLPYQIISGAEEAYFNGLANQAEFPQAQKLLLFDLGGGSTEFTLLQAKQILRAESVNIGIRRFESEFGNDYAALKARVQSLLPTFSATEKADLTLVGIGGTACSLAALLQNLQVYDSQLVHGSFISTVQLDKLLDNISSLSRSQLAERLPFEQKRADIIQLGTILVKEIVDSFQSSGFFVSDRSLQFGVLRQSNDKLAKMLKRKEICLK
ncbi:MAG: hypothetical protein R6U84_10130, partial [Candidatus Cloacimonadales bacterium]